MCSVEERDKRIRDMMSRKLGKKIDKMNSVIEKISMEVNENAVFISNTYGITNANLCPQIAEGEKYISSLSPDITKSVRDYTGNSYRSINTSLRKNKVCETSRDILNIDSAFRTAPPLTYPMIVYRGIKGVDKLRGDDGFSSCSLRSGISMWFGGGKLFEITIPFGTRVLFVKPISLNENEDEVLLDRCGAFREIIPGKLIYMSHLTEEDDDV